MTDSATARGINVGIVQMQCGADTGANLDKALKLTREASEQGARIVCLPELFRSRYFCQTEDAALFSLAEPIPGPTTQAFEKLARELNITAIVSVFERRAPGLYHNSVAVIDGQHGILGTYRKMHIPDDPRYYEKFYFTPGDLGFKAFAVGDATIGTLICWDQWYPEAARLTALRGAEVLFYPTAIGWHPEEKEEVGENQLAAWETIQRSHAIANGCYVVAVNRLGFEPDPASDGAGIQFWGSSFITAPDGQVLFRAPVDAEVVHVQELDLNMVGNQRHGWPFLRDRRIDAYEEITRRFIDTDIQ
jgi:N-carbamoylputrescine amidase